jgi:hypothetical protein
MEGGDQPPPPNLFAATADFGIVGGSLAFLFAAVCTGTTSPLRAQLTDASNATIEDSTAW